jgi:hypothetical protein
MSKKAVIVGSLAGAVAIHLVFACVSSSSPKTAAASGEDGASSSPTCPCAAPQYVTSPCTASTTQGTTTTYWAVQTGINGSDGNPMPAATLLKLASATEVLSASAAGYAPPTTTVTTEGMPVTFAVGEGTLVASCGTSLTTSPGALPSASILFTVRAQ